MSKLIIPSEIYKKEIKEDKNPINSFKLKKAFLKTKYYQNLVTVKFLTPYFMPGNIYYFKYSSSKDSYDAAPMVLSLGQIKNSKNEILEYGINLNMIPLKFKVVILDRIFKLCKNYQDTLSASNKIGLIPLDKDILDVVLKNTGWEGALFKWKSGRINNKIVIEYVDWYISLHWIPDELKNIQLSNIESNYLQKMRFDK